MLFEATGKEVRHFLILMLLVGIPFAHPRESLRARTVGSGQALPRLTGLGNENGELVQLRREISENLRSTMRHGRLVIPLRFYTYRVGKHDNFYTIMARVWQDEDTLASVNHLANPGELAEGDTLLIPNARGLYATGEKPTDARGEVISLQQGWFLPGKKYAPLERSYFRGEGFLYPLKKIHITSGFGNRLDPFNHRATFHGGIDLRAREGDEVYASRDGVVIQAGLRGGYGNLVVIRHEYDYRTYYGHLSRIDVKPGESVKAGERIGLAGHTGRATGSHLHFEVRRHGISTRPHLLGEIIRTESDRSAEKKQSVAGTKRPGAEEGPLPDASHGSL